MKVLVIGCGLIGSEIARDLARGREFEVTAFDQDAEALGKLASQDGVKRVLGEVRNQNLLREILSEQDIVVSAVPGSIGFQTLHGLIDAAKNSALSVVDISFMPEDARELDDLAKEHGITVVVDCGVAPGLSNILVGNAVSRLDIVERVAIYAGGLVEKPLPPWFYKAVFSPIDVIEEYTRPARVLQDGKIAVLDPLSQVETVDFPAIGKLEAFPTDGLRTLLHSVSARTMVEKTLRYPGHIEKIRVLRDAGAFSKEKVKVGETWVAPIQVTAMTLFPQWKLKEGDRDLTILKVEVEGTTDGKAESIKFQLIDHYDREMRVTSMARTTGYTATAIVRVIASGTFSEKGIIPPEKLGADEKCFSQIISLLRERGITIEFS